MNSRKDPSIRTVVQRTRNKRRSAMSVQTPRLTPDNKYLDSVIETGETGDVVLERCSLTLKTQHEFGQHRQKSVRKKSNSKTLTTTTVACRTKSKFTIDPLSCTDPYWVRITTIQTASALNATSEEPCLLEAFESTSKTLRTDVRRKYTLPACCPFF